MLSILIVNWNTREMLRACLFSLRNACRELSHEVIVVDNASGDGSVAMVREEFPEVLLGANEHNAGYAAANNQAYEQAKGEWLWLLNPDTEVLEGTPQQLVEFLRANERCGAVASALIDARTGRPQRSCRTFPTPAALWAEASGLARFFPRSRRFGFYRMGWWSGREARAVEQPMASSLLLRRAAVESSGGLFDEAFPIFFNDVDLCWRLWQSGWQIWYLPSAGVLHHGGASTRLVKPQMIHSSHQALQHFYFKHFRARVAAPLFWSTLAMTAAAGWWRRRRALRHAAARRAVAKN